MKEDKSKGKVEDRVSLTRLDKMKKKNEKLSLERTPFLNRIVICEMDAIR